MGSRYKTDSTSPENLQAHLDERAARGWRLVTAFPSTRSSDGWIRFIWEVSADAE